MTEFPASVASGNGPETYGLLRFDFSQLSVGVAEYPDGPTGCTVFRLAKTCAVATDIRGGSPGYLAPIDRVDAICLAGGSIYGLEAAMGVQKQLFAEREYSTVWGNIALVQAGIIYDWGGRDNAIYPDLELGREAYRSLESGSFPLGRRGAGSNATVGKGIPGLERETAGQGGAFRQLGDVKLAVFTVVNAVGVIVNRAGDVVRGCLDTKTGARNHYAMAFGFDA